ncbi:hypothetical protein [Anatilimnocola floriformis]|uniref:hypothetical protein n=1 Tax=Anatilimnocola floriformis TaxID=2948575 RepID=UPI0020C32845|nr:hypothetical protein [Anatilimnocola floriformis]
MRCILFLFFFGSLSAVAHGQVGDPTLRTDHPQYAGEGAFQTATDCVKFALGDQKLTDQEKALAIYNWLLTHQWHLLSPQENCVPGKQADAAKTQEDLIVYDAARARFSYGYGLCGTVHAWNEPYWKAAGFNARRRAFPGHANSEILYGDAWHAFDTDMAGLLFRKDGVVAGYADIIADPSLATSVKPPFPHYPFAWPSDFQSMKSGWQEVAKNPNKWFAMYNGGYECQPGIVNLRKGETFTRWFDPDHYGGPTKRRFWHNLKNGPVRDWTFANNGEPRHDGKDHNARGNAAYCNGEFVWQPDPSEILPPRKGRDWGKDHVLPEIEFRHWSPYVICGDPEDDANPMTGKATNGFVVEGDATGDVLIKITTARGTKQLDHVTFPLDLTEYVKGEYGWRLAVAWDGPESGVKDLKFTTTTQINQAIYPRLKPQGSTVNYRATNQAVLEQLPDFSLPEEETKRFERTEMRSSNLAYRGRGANSRLAYETTNNKPASVVFPVTYEGSSLEEVRAAIRYQVRVPPPEQHDYRLDVSWDDGQTWQTFAKAEIPKDNEFSSGWLAGSAKRPNKNSGKALVRVTLYAGGYKTGLIDAQLYGICRAAEKNGPLLITYGWRENGELKTAEQKLPAGVSEQTWKIATGAKIRDEFVRMTAN